MTQEAKIEENPHKSDSTKEEFVADLDTYREKVMTNSNAVSPDAMHRQMTKLLEAAIAKLPESFRVVLMLREVEGLSVDETAEVLQIPKDTVKTRLVEARHKAIDSKLRNALHDTFTFAGSDCDALTERVLATVYSKWA
jgi:RNA polymerase sigma-70 factor, ECF subfamily